MSGLLRRPLALAATGVALAAPSLILPPTDILRPDKPIVTGTGKPDVLPFDVLFAAGHLAPGMIGLASGGSGPAPDFVAVSANGSGTSAAMPSGWAAGDLLIIFATTYRGGTSCLGPTTPAGWTDLGGWSNNSGTTYMSRTNAFYRIAQSGDSTVQLSRPGGETSVSSRMMAFRGVNTASPFEGLESLSNQSKATSIPYAQITTLGINRVVVQAISSWVASSVSSTPEAGWTERFDNAGTLGVSVDTRTFASAGLTSAGNQTRSANGEWGRMAFAIKPALV